MPFLKGHKPFSHLISTKIEKECLHCGIKYLIHNYRKDENKFCSRDCQHKYLVGRTGKTKGIKTGKPAWNTGLKDYKSGEDNCNWKGGKPKCIDCGEETVSYRAKRCPDCNKKWQRGNNIWNWKGGISPNPERTTLSYKKWRLDIFQRDWFTCQYPGCGYKGKDIQAHHIKRVKDNPELINEIDNGITLCVTCHNKTRCKEWFYEKLFAAIIKLWK